MADTTTDSVAELMFLPVRFSDSSNPQTSVRRSLPSAGEKRIVLRDGQTPAAKQRVE